MKAILLLTILGPAAGFLAPALPLQTVLPWHGAPPSLMRGIEAQAGLAPATHFQIPSFADILEEPLRAVVRVESLTAPVAEGGTVVATGSGAIIDLASGDLVTNAHVVVNGLAFRVQLPDGRWRDAELIGDDAATDLAVLRIGTDGLSQVDMADSDLLRIGDVVFAAGYPLGLDQTVTMGIVSGLSRSGGGTQLTDYIQTDAAINSGNSGGPLLDIQGRLIGINSTILSNSGGSIGIGFAIPAQMVRDVTSQLIEFGEVRRGHIGVVLGSVKEADSEAAGLQDWAGALIISVEKDSPADKAGLLPGDVVTMFNGRNVLSPQGLRAWIGTSRVGEPVALVIWRSGAIREAAIAPVPFDRPGIGSLADLGAIIRAAGETDRLPAQLSGVIIDKVLAGSSAEMAGLLQGDVILSVNNELVETPQVCDRLIGEAEGRARIVVYRNGMIRPFILEGTLK